ncbi:MAG TPA: AmmeMemoRadiSam system protein B [Terriglobales bacterium]|nr:AmmeMemoRadiSam system protein B [Terriglobales bacterium]
MEALRHPAVAGRFYPGDRKTLIEDLESYLSPAVAAKTALGCIAPHAGYMYSGPVAGAVYANIQVPQRCVVLCPNHTGRGRPLAIMSSGAWQTPLGSVPIDAALATTLKEHLPLVSEDGEAHRSEHAIEVQLPFLQRRQPHFALVPIALGTGNFEILEKLGLALADVLKAQAGPVLMVASSDMNHYESDRITRVKDHKAIERILTLDARGLYETIINEDISMCGFGPAVAMLTAAKSLGASTAELIKYATSGDVSGDREMVVGYAGIVVR